MEMRPEYRKKSIRSYVVRAGRMTDGQRKAFETSWPTYGLRLADGAINTDEVFGRSGPKVLEIGFGMGDSLLQMALLNLILTLLVLRCTPLGLVL